MDSIYLDLNGRGSSGTVTLARTVERGTQTLVAGQRILCLDYEGSQCEADVRTAAEDTVVIQLDWCSFSESSASLPEPTFLQLA